MICQLTPITVSRIFGVPHQITHPNILGQGHQGVLITIVLATRKASVGGASQCHICSLPCLRGDYMNHSDCRYSCATSGSIRRRKRKRTRRKLMNPNPNPLYHPGMPALTSSCGLVAQRWTPLAWLVRFYWCSKKNPLLISP